MFKYGHVNYVFGAPGSGKSTLLAKLVQKLRKRHIVYSNFPVSGAILIKDEELGHFRFPDGSIIVLDECGVSYNNRRFKDGLLSDPMRLQYWKLVRHYKNSIFICSQSYSDVDLKLRQLCEHFYLIKRWLPGFSICKPILKKIDIDEKTHEPTDFYLFDLPWHFHICFRPKYYKYFNSYDAPYLPPYYKTDPEPEPVKFPRVKKLVSWIRDKIPRKTPEADGDQADGETAFSLSCGKQSEEPGTDISRSHCEIADYNLEK